MEIYKKIDQIYGPSSWTVKWSLNNGILYADNIEIGGLDTLLTSDNRTVKEVLLSKENFIACIGEKGYKGYFADYRSAKEKGFYALSTYMKEFNIVLRYEDKRDVHGSHCITVMKGDATYESYFDWPYTQSKEIEETFSSLRKLINPEKMRLIVALQ